MTTTTIYFVRHGTVHNPENNFYGRRPYFRLSTQGLAEAAALTPYFASKPIERIFSSPLLRTRQTARAILKGCEKCQISLTRDLLEVYVPYEGLPLAELEAKQWDIYTGNQPPYEVPEDIFKRISRFLRRTLIAYAGREVVAVTHADVVLFLSLWAKGYEPTYANKALVEQKKLDLDFPMPASVTALRWTAPNSLPELEYLRVS